MKKIKMFAVDLALFIGDLIVVSAIFPTTDKSTILIAACLLWLVSDKISSNSIEYQKNNP